MFEHFVKEVGCAKAGCFGADKASAVGEAFACQDAVFIVADDLLVLTEEIADFTSANAHIPCGDVHVRTDMTIEFIHKALAETHDFIVALAGGVEVTAAFAAAHRKGSEAVFEGLFKCKELHCVKVDVLLEAEATLVRADCVVELNAIAGVDVVVAVVIHPRNAEDDLTVGFNKTFQNYVFAQFLFVLFNCGCD